MELILTTILGLIVGIIASFIFWGYQRFIKPDVTIAPLITATRDKETGKKIYRFKIRNNGKNQVVGIIFKAWVCDLIDVPGGKISRGIADFPIKNSNTLTLAPKGRSKRPWGLTEERIFRSTPDFDFENMLSEERRIMVTLRVSDGLTGTTDVQQRVFSKEDVKEGIFAFGASLEVICDKLRNG